MKYTKINDNWNFWQEKNAFALVWGEDPFAVKVDLPHDAMILSAPTPDTVNAGNTGFRDGGVYDYTKHIVFDEADNEKIFMLKFEGVYMNAMVYVNAQQAAMHPYGYSCFYVELNDYIKFGEDNEIRVIVRNSGMPNSRWYSGGGIYRDVYLLEAARTYLRPDGCFVKTKHVYDEYAIISVENEIINKNFNSQNIEITVDVIDADGKVVASDKAPVAMFEGESRKNLMNFTIADAKLWSDENPYLYTVETKLMKNGQVIDEDADFFGIRTITVDAVSGLRVNGKEVKLKGACIHHDNGIIGSAEYYDAEYRKVTKLKEEGFNAIRMSHNPAGSVLLDVCDELGMYVMDEAFDMWERCKTENDYGLFFDKYFLSDVEAMVRADFNHPSVVLYSVGNEIPEIGTNTGAKRCNQIVEKIKSLDDTRFTLAGLNGIFSAGDRITEIVSDIMGKPMSDKGENVNEFMAAMMGHMREIANHPIVSERIDKACANLDIAGYNYMDDRYEADHKKYPNRVLCGSETYPSAIARNWTYIKNHSHVIGDFTWTGWDYLGESGIGVASYGGSGDGFGTPYPCGLSYTGDIDITGFRKPASYLKEIVFGKRKAPFICCQRPEYFGQTPNMTPWALTDSIESWSFPGYEGKPIKVEIYSPGDEVELFINGESMGKKPAGEAANYRVFFDVTYVPGKIQAISYENGESIGFVELQSADIAADLSVKVEEGKNGELFFIALENVDEVGRLVTEEEIDICAELAENNSENATLFIGSGTHSPVLSFVGGETKTWNGRAQIIVRKLDSSLENTVIIKSKYGEKRVNI